MSGDELAPVPVCPECAAGKHPNCDGGSWDPVDDMPADCPCPDPEHTAHAAAAAS